MSTEHTADKPTPWRIEDGCVLDANGGIVSDIETSEQLKAWLHIVHCVNSHDALVEALSGIVHAIELKGERYLSGTEALIWEKANKALRQAEEL